MTNNIHNIVRRFKSIFSHEKMQNIAISSGFLLRKRKLSPMNLIVSFLMEFSTGNPADLSGLLRMYNQVNMSDIKYSSFYTKLAHPKFPQFAMEVYKNLANSMMVEHLYQKQGKLFDRFTDVFIQDGSVLGLNKKLKDIFPGRFWKQAPAAAEVHAFYSLQKSCFVDINIAPDIESECNYMPEKNEHLKDTLSLFDSGYRSLDKLHNIEESSGYFIVKWHRSCNPKVISMIRGPRTGKKGCGKHFKSFKLRKRSSYDFYVTFPHGGKKYKNQKLRFVALWNPVKKQHVYFVTNVPEDKLNMLEIGEIYRLRWVIELMFKELKSYTGLRKFLTANPHIAEGLIWVSLITFLVRKYILVFAQLKLGYMLSHLKAAATSHLYMPGILMNIISIKKLEFYFLKAYEFLSTVCQYSNRHRKKLFDRLNLA